MAQTSPFVDYKVVSNNDYLGHEGKGNDTYSRLEGI